MTQTECAYQGGLLCAVFARGDSHAQHGSAGVAHDRLDISKIHVDQPGNGNDIRDPLYSLHSPWPRQAMQALY